MTNEETGGFQASVLGALGQSVVVCDLERRIL
jgi:hypothetical protein